MYIAVIIQVNISKKRDATQPDNNNNTNDKILFFINVIIRYELAIDITIQINMDIIPTTSAFLFVISVYHRSVLME